MSKRLLILTSTRAEYGLLRPIARALREGGADAQWLVTGTHLLPAHGHTIDAIIADGEPIAARVEMPLSGDSPAHIAAAAAAVLSGTAQQLAILKPDAAIILGDRHEMLAAATACALANVPIAHIHGGEVTEGAQDDAFRHAITKLAYWHFPATESYAARIAQLGEERARIFALGAPGVDNLAMPLLTRPELEAQVGMPLEHPFALLTYHPETLSAHPPAAQIETLLAALRNFPHVGWLITGANADSGGATINAALESFAASMPRAKFIHSLGQTRYLSAMRACALVVGNSSSGVIEAPAMGRLSVNIGARQQGRFRSPSVIDCACDVPAISAAIGEALSPARQQSVQPTTAFGIPGQVAPAIAACLLRAELPVRPRKPFIDLK